MKHDVIVIGGGAAGCVVTGRLAGDAGASVLLLEAGASDANPLIHVPAGFSKILAHDLLVWPFDTIPQAQLDGKTRRFRAGKVIGGGSSINAMCYVRGQARDYDQWQDAVGDTGHWDHTEMLKHFRLQERNDTFHNEHHGVDGPLRVTLPRRINELNLNCLRAFQEYGLPYNPDYNGATQRGVSPVQSTMGDARRCSSADAFLKPVKGGSRLTISTHSSVNHIIVEKGRAVGVSYTRRGSTLTAYADEIILSAGAIQSPKILMLSGIGPEAHLRAHGVKVVLDAPDVGQNLQDHPIVPVSTFCKRDMGYQRSARGLGAAKAALQYALLKEGPASSNGVETVSYFNPDDLEGEPTIQCYHMPIISEDGLSPTGTKAGITFELVVLQPQSRGSIALRDANPQSFPLIDPNYMAHPEDMRRAVGSIRAMREVMQMPGLKEVLEPEHFPGLQAQSDAELEAFVKTVATTMWHPVGTCRMGRDNTAVVDAELRVNGIAGLRVIDASIMPNIVSANTNAPTMALANKGVDLFLGHKVAATA